MKNVGILSLAEPDIEIGRASKIYLKIEPSLGSSFVKMSNSGMIILDVKELYNLIVGKNVGASVYLIDSEEKKYMSRPEVFDRRNHKEVNYNSWLSGKPFSLTLEEKQKIAKRRADNVDWSDIDVI